MCVPAALALSARRSLIIASSKADTAPSMVNSILFIALSLSPVKVSLGFTCKLDETLVLIRFSGVESISLNQDLYIAINQFTAGNVRWRTDEARSLSDTSVGSAFPQPIIFFGVKAITGETYDDFNC